MNVNAILCAECMLYVVPGAITGLIGGHFLAEKVAHYAKHFCLHDAIQHNKTSYVLDCKKIEQNYYGRNGLWIMLSIGILGGCLNMFGTLTLVKIYQWHKKRTYTHLNVNSPA